jgi:hypothetical protein
MYQHCCLRRLKEVLTDCADLTRHFIDFFAPSLVVVKPILLQLRDAIAVMDRTEDMRRDYSLNPLIEEGNIGQPTLKTVSSIQTYRLASIGLHVLTSRCCCFS